jgi:hypothetical protein
MNAPIFIPRDFFAPIASERVLVPALKRQLVTAAVLGGGGANGEWVSPAVLRKASRFWREGPGHAVREKPVRGVLSVLLELEQFGLVLHFESAEGGGYLVTPKEAAA